MKGRIQAMFSKVVIMKWGAIARLLREEVERGWRQLALVEPFLDLVERDGFPEVRQGRTPME